MSDNVKISRRLNLEARIDRADGTFVVVHSMPISTETFESYQMILGQTLAAMYEMGIGNSVGPNMAAGLLKHVATRSNRWNEVQTGLLPEIFRLTNVIVAENGAWRPIPWDVARQRNLIDAEDAAEVTGAIIFFIVVSALSRRSQVGPRLAEPGLIWGFKTTLSTPMELAASLPISTQAETIIEKPAAGSSPSVLISHPG